MFRKKLEELINDNQDKLIIDLREKKDYDKETYPGAIHIYHKDFYKYLDILPKNKRIYLFCYTGVTGDEIAEDLSLKGYDIYSIEEGYRAIMRMNIHNMMNNGRNNTAAARVSNNSIPTRYFGKNVQKTSQKLN